MKTLFFTMLLVTFTTSQALNTSAPQQIVENYIARYKDWAVADQIYSGIPASIKIATGIVETSSGQSRLALQANNHFGTKWWEKRNSGTHEYIESLDDEFDPITKKRVPSKFIKFASVEDSYRYHSEMLRGQPRYRPLFSLDRADYKSWAYGLQQYGYATAGDYAQKLIKIIEQYELYKYDMPSTLSLDETDAGLQNSNNTPMPVETPAPTYNTPQPTYNKPIPTYNTPQPTNNKVKNTGLNTPKTETYQYEQLASGTRINAQGQKVNYKFSEIVSKPTTRGKGIEPQEDIERVYMVPPVNR